MEKRPITPLILPDGKETKRKQALIFLLFLGFVSFFSDFTHEGARSMYGQYLGLLGVSAFYVSFTSGLGEFIGHAMRLGTGYIADKTGKYWLMMILGYSVNLLAIPLLGFINPTYWELALVLILIERVGKAIRAPAKSALTSFTSSYFGAGKAFALHEVLDQLGAFLGPLLVFSIISSRSSDIKTYQYSFFILGIFALVTIVILVISKIKYPSPKDIDISKDKQSVKIKDNPNFILYLVCVSFLALGFVDFPFISFHLSTLSLLDIKFIPLIYSIAMGIDAVSALFFGYLYDKKGLIAFIGAVSVSILIIPFIFLRGSIYLIFAGIAIWGICMGAQESIFKAIVCRYTNKDHRASAYGVFGGVFGTSWFIGSTIIGLLYEVNIIFLVIFCSSSLLISLVSSIVLLKKEHINTSKAGG
ncbi:MAG: Major Facilitator Superfamily protein [Firmicutes bacterium ADurb.Bin080]|jgi:MFS family permease|nr:MAG: Major Facilitator Superfamily protein [Firmicutes bacterium ADurb.Bin080]